MQQYLSFLFLLLFFGDMRMIVKGIEAEFNYRFANRYERPMKLKRRTGSLRAWRMRDCRLGCVDELCVRSGRYSLDDAGQVVWTRRSTRNCELGRLCLLSNKYPYLHGSIAGGAFRQASCMELSQGSCFKAKPAPFSDFESQSWEEICRIASFFSPHW